jgi:hypothetical protein
MILEGEYDLGKLFALIAELGESLNENRSLSVSLYAQATNVKVGGSRRRLWVWRRLTRLGSRRLFIPSQDSYYGGGCFWLPLDNLSESFH